MYTCTLYTHIPYILHIPYAVIAISIRASVVYNTTHISIDYLPISHIYIYIHIYYIYPYIHTHPYAICTHAPYIPIYHIYCIYHMQ
jgi:hypothetical protein